MIELKKRTQILYFLFECWEDWIKKIDSFVENNVVI
jgi:hypothetical protein